jgi:hypothetical protein
VAYLRGPYSIHIWLVSLHARRFCPFVKDEAKGSYTQGEPIIRNYWTTRVICVEADCKPEVAVTVTLPVPVGVPGVPPLL